MKKILPYSRQYIDQKDIKRVTEVLKSDYLTSGPQTIKFEKELSKFCKSKYSLCTNSATSALHLGFLSLGVKKGDHVWTSAITFVSTASSAVMCGAKVNLVDIDLNDFNISIEDLEKKLIAAKRKKVLPKVIVPVHLGGLSCKMKEIKLLSKKFNFRILEDASHALGSKYGKYPVGSCKYSDITVFSFHPVKTITTGEGGAIMTNDLCLFKKIKILREHGIVRNKKFFNNKAQGLWYYEKKFLGYNYRMSDINSSLGLSQLQKIKKIVKRRAKIFEIYKKSFKRMPIQLQKIDNNNSSLHLTIILVSKKINRSLFRYLRSKNIFVNKHYIPLYYHPFFKFKKKTRNDFSNAQEYYERCISIPNYFGLRAKDQSFVINAIKKFCFSRTN